MTDSDLVHAGRALPKRPPGASELVQRIYTLLTEHPEGMTRNELHAELREGWLDTDAYRAFEHHLAMNRKVVYKSHPGRQLSYGSDEFKISAQRWWIYRKLTNMESRGTARRVQGTKFWQAARPPQVHTVTSSTKTTYVPLDVEAKRKREHAATQDNIRRQIVKARLLEDLNARYQGKSAVRDHLLETIRIAYDHLCGR